MTQAQSGPKLRSTHAYPVKLPVFEGPLDLLLHLIRTNKLDISEVAISAVTEQYLQYLALMEAMDLDVAGEFLVIAATLMEIKSRTLLPRPDPIAETNPDELGQDPRAELVARLLEYERFQQVAEQLQELAVQTQRTFTRSVVEQWEGAVPLVELAPRDLLEALRRMSAEEEEQNKGPAPLRVRRHAINIRQAAEEIYRRVHAHPGPFPFSSLTIRSGQRRDRSLVLVYFLAILELIRLGQVSAWQEGVDGEIYLLPHENGGDGAGQIPADAQESRGSASGSPGG